LFSSECAFILSECERDRSYILTESELSTCDVIEQTPLCF